MLKGDQQVLLYTKHNTVPSVNMNDTIVWIGIVIGLVIWPADYGPFK